MMPRAAWLRVRARKEASRQRAADQRQQARNDRAAREAGVLGLTAAQVILREQLAAKVAADTAERLAVLLSDDPTPEPEPTPGPLTQLFNKEISR